MFLITVPPRPLWDLVYCVAKCLVSLKGMLKTLWDDTSVPGDSHVIYQTEAAI